MFRYLKNAFAVTAAAGLLVAQPAMATRSAESLPSVGAKVSAAQVGRVGSRVGKAEQLRGTPIIPIVITIAVIIAVLAAASTDGNQNDSPG